MPAVRKYLKRFRKHIRRLLIRQGKSEQDPQIQKLQDDVEKVARDIDALIILMQEERAKEREEKVTLLKMVQELQDLETTLASERKPQGLNRQERDSRLQQNIAELQASEKFCKAKKKATELEKASAMTDMDQLEESIRQLEANLASEPMKLDPKKEMFKPDVQRRRDIPEPGSSLKLREEQKKTMALEKERENLARERKHLEERIGHLEAALDFEKSKWDQTTKLEEEKNTLQLETIRELQEALKCSEEKRKNAEHERDHLMNILEHLDERVAQLEASLASEQDKHPQEPEKTYLRVMNSNGTPIVSKSKESQTISEEGGEMAMGTQGQLVEYLQLFRDLASELDNQEDEKEEISLDIELRNALLRQTIAELKASSNNHREQQMVAQECTDSAVL